MTTSSAPHTIDTNTSQTSSSAGGVQPPLNGNDELFSGDRPTAKARDISRRADIPERDHPLAGAHPGPLL